MNYDRPTFWAILSPHGGEIPEIQPKMAHSGPFWPVMGIIYNFGPKIGHISASRACWTEIPCSRPISNMVLVVKVVCTAP